jgi:cytochrome c-type biogenesis protein CcmH
MTGFWIVAGGLCFATVLLLILAGRRRQPDATHRAEGALEIYKDQLAELDRETAAGAITPAEADAQRTEIGRRLLEASRDKSGRNGSQSRWPLVAALLVPVLAAGLYVKIGSFGQEDVPRAARLAAAQSNNDWEALVALVEQHLEKNPKDVEGWKLLAPNYLNMRRFGDAANAMQKLIELQGPTPDLYADMGEALVFQNQGLMTAQSVAAINAALKLDPKNPKGRYYSALALTQDGKREDARKAFESLLADSPTDAPWRKAVEGQIAQLAPGSAAPEISGEQMKDAGNMSAEDRNAMIRTMVDGLDQKLKDNPADIEGWLRLIRARTVLSETDKATAALATARLTFAGKAEETKLLNDLATELQLK